MEFLGISKRCLRLYVVAHSPYPLSCLLFPHLVYLTLWDDSPQNGTKVVGWERAIAKETSGLFTIQSSIGRCNFPGLQEWLILPKGMDNGKCLIQNAMTCQYLDLHLGLQENGTRVQGWQREELMGNQVWMIEDATVDISSYVRQILEAEILLDF
ncbi:hypothetical protein QX201_007411 [Fusarium graminearum]